MKKHSFRLPDGLAVALCLGLLLAAGLFAAFWPQGDFSDFERRYLASAPSAPSLANWKTDKEIESYLSDRIPFRRVMVGIDATANVLTGRRTQLETWPVAGAFLEKPVQGTEDGLNRRLTQLDEAARKANAPWKLVVPTGHGYLLRENMNALLQPLYEAETPLYETLAANAGYVALGDDFTAENAYYATDHHWSLDGVYAAYTAYCRSLGLEPLALDAFEITTFPGFFGTTYSRSGYPFAKADTLACAQPETGVHLTILDDGSEHDSLIFPEHAATYDGYAVYLGGNHGLLEITNANAPEGTLMVFKDSFANSLLPLLSAHYSRIVAMDARYYGGNFSDAIAAAGQVDQVLYVYSLDSLLNDTMVARKVGR